MSLYYKFPPKQNLSPFTLKPPPTCHDLCYSCSQMKALLLDGVHPEAKKVLENAGFSVVAETAPSAEFLEQHLPGAHMVGLRSGTRLSAEHFAMAPELLAVGRYGIGVENIDLAAATAAGVAVFNAPTGNARSVAELVIGLVFALFRKIPARSAALHGGRWAKGASGCQELRGKTLGLVGYGNIAKILSGLAEGVGMRVEFFDPFPAVPLGNARPAASLDALLASADVLSVHVPGGKATENLFDAEVFAKMKRGAYFINAARGSVADLDALASALESGHLAGAALDVYPKEPKKAGDAFELAAPLLGREDVVLSPHVGGSTQEAQTELGREVSAALAKYVAEGNAMGSVNFPAAAPPPLAEGFLRCAVPHENAPGTLAGLMNIISEMGGNICAETLVTRGEIGYAVIDAEQLAPAQLDAALAQAKGLRRARVLPI